MANAEADFLNALAGQRQRWANEEGEHTKRTEEMAKEVETLEIRKIRSYKYNAKDLLDELEKEAKDKIKQAENLLVEVQVKEEDNDELKEELENKLDELGGREVDIKKEESRLRNLQKGIEHQQEMTNQGTDRLNQSLLEFKDYKAKEERAIKDKQKELFLWDRTLVTEREALDKTAQTLRDWEIRLKDREGVLKRNYERLHIPIEKQS